MLTINKLRTEYLENPIGIDARAPRFSWVLGSSRQGVIQENYHVLAASDPGFSDILWDSGVVNSADSVRVRYQGKPLCSGQGVYWKVTVTAGGEKADSETAYFEMGLLEPEDWKAKWINVDIKTDDLDTARPAFYLRKSFSVSKKISRARIYQTAHGLYHFWLNGEKGTHDQFNPGFTSYYHRLQYQTYDITSLLKEGQNVWAVMIGEGWWRGTIGGQFRNNFGYTLDFLGQIVIDYEDGTSEVIGSDENFRKSCGNILLNDMKYGEVYDARIAMDGWTGLGFDDSTWENVRLAEGEHIGMDALIPQRSVFMREKEVFRPKLMIDTAGNTLLDFGQNIAGYVRMTLRGLEPGQKVHLQHNEELKNGAFDLGNVQQGLADETHFQEIVYYGAGASTEKYQPSFAIFAFRYVLLEGYNIAAIQDGDFEAVAVYSDLEQTGDFTCSNELINQLVRNSRWSQKGNFLDVPTDCPSRERSPWTGDSQVYAKTASEFMNVYPFFEKWMEEFPVEQYADGMISNSAPLTTSLHSKEEADRLIREEKYTFFKPGVVGPDGTPSCFDGSAGWGDTVTITPYTMYLCYGDRQILENLYGTAKKWVNYMIRAAKDVSEPNSDGPEYSTYVNGVRDADYLFDTRFHFGEWLEPDSEEATEAGNQDIEGQKKRTDPLVATAYLYHSSVLLGRIAAILGKEEDSAFYTDYSKEVKRVYNKYLIAEDGTISKGHQAPYVRVLQFGLVDEDKKAKVAQKLLEEVRKANMHLNTGFLSTPFILFQLLENGFVEEAYQVLEQPTSPGWLYPVLRGATTIWESWQAIDLHNCSYNHYSYGAVCDFLFSAVCGIKPLLETPGYKHFRIAPVPGGHLTHAEAKYTSIYGEIRSAWEKKDGGVEYRFEIPVNTTAEVILPGRETETLGSGCYTRFVK